MNTQEMKARLTAFFDTATPADISGLLKRTNYDFYKNVRLPGEAWFETDFSVTETTQVVTFEIPVAPAQEARVSNRPVTYVGRGQPADCQGLALAA